MSFHNQPILPAIRNMKQFDEFLNSSFSYGVILDIHLGQLKGVIREAQKHGKNMMVHVDLIQGIKHDKNTERSLFARTSSPLGLFPQDRT